MSSVSLFSIISTLMESDFTMFHVTTRSQSSVRQDKHPPEIILYFHILFYFITWNMIVKIVLILSTAFNESLKNIKSWHFHSHIYNIQSWNRHLPLKQFKIMSPVRINIPRPVLILHSPVFSIHRGQDCLHWSGDPDCSLLPQSHLCNACKEHEIMQS